MPHTVTAATEFAPAKVNLTLEVLGRRTDGMHEIRSLVAFAANVGDRLTTLRDRDGRVRVSGPFASQITGPNLAETALNLLRAHAPRSLFPSVRLDKNLPVASGIGGGSSDAAAMLRLLSRTAVSVADTDMRAIAAHLGSDVPVCLLASAAFMTGTGNHVEAARLPNDLYAVLANPLTRVPLNKTAQVFDRLKATPMHEPLPDDRGAGQMFFAVPDLIAYIEKRGNALERPARELFPAVGRVLSGLGRLKGARLAQLAGAGPTCFAIFEAARDAMDGAEELGERHPDWWIKATRLA